MLADLRSLRNWYGTGNGLLRYHPWICLKIGCPEIHGLIIVHHDWLFFRFFRYFPVWNGYLKMDMAHFFELYCHIISSLNCYLASGCLETTQAADSDIQLCWNQQRAMVDFLSMVIPLGICQWMVERMGMLVKISQTIGSTIPNDLPRVVWTINPYGWFMTLFYEQYIANNWFVHFQTNRNFNGCLLPLRMVVFNVSRFSKWVSRNPAVCTSRNAEEPGLQSGSSLLAFALHASLQIWRQYIFYTTIFFDGQICLRIKSS